MTQEKQIIYDYYETPVYVNQYEKNLKKDGYIKLPFTSYKSETHPNLVINNQKYKTVNLYVLANSHNTAYDGELILEHMPITNGNEKVYVCIPLKTQSGNSEQTTIDKIISGTFRANLEVNLNPLLVTKIGKITSEGNVIYFYDPILISTPFYAFANTDNLLFPALSEYDDYEEIGVSRKSNIIEGFKLDSADSNGKDSGNPATTIGDNLAIVGDMVFECANVDVDSSTETIDLIPAGGDFSKNFAVNQLQSTTINFFSFVIIVCIAAFISPMIYRSVFVSFIDKVIDTHEDKPGNLKTFDVIIFVFLLGYSIYMVTAGIGGTNPNTVLTSCGIIFFIFLFLSTGVIMMLKESNPGVYKLNRLANMEDVPYKFDIFTSFIDVIRNEPTFVFGSFFVLMVILTLLSYSGVWTGKWDVNQARSGIQVIIPAILFTVFYASIIHNTVV